MKGVAMNKLKSFARRFIKDESGQGMAEYVLLIVVVVGVAFIFKDKIRGMVEKKMTAVGDEFNSFSSQ